MWANIIAATSSGSLLWAVHAAADVETLSTTTMNHPDLQENVSHSHPPSSINILDRLTFDFLSSLLKSVTLFLLVCWTVIANSLVFVVLYKNPRLRTVPNLLVGNLAFSDLCLGCFVLPFSAVYAITLDWRFGKTVCELWLSCDIFVCTASIWNLSMIGLDRYWAITSPVQYLAKRNIRFGCTMILIVWVFSAAISLAPFIGWKSFSTEGNYVLVNETYQCVHFQDLPSFTIYSATGSFWIPLTVMFFVYFRIYIAFEQHKIRQMYRQKVIRKHLESTILAELSHVLPTSDEFAKENAEEEEEEDEDDLDSGDFDFNSSSEERREFEKISEENEPIGSYKSGSFKRPGSFNKSPGAGSFRGPGGTSTRHTNLSKKGKRSRCNSRQASVPELPRTPTPPLNGKEAFAANGVGGGHNHRQIRATKSAGHAQTVAARAVGGRGVSPLTYDKVMRNKRKEERRKHFRKSLQRKPKAISAAKEKRGVRVLGIILGCFTFCWTPFFIMYLVIGFCTDCRINAHVEQFITWLGYANSAMNPIIYTVFNRDYQIALKRLLTRQSSTKRRQAGRYTK